MKYCMFFIIFGLVYTCTAYWLILQASDATDHAARLLQQAREDHVWASITDPSILSDKYSEIYAFLILGGIHLQLAIMSFGMLTSLILKKRFEKNKKSFTNKQRRQVSIMAILVILVILAAISSDLYDTVPEAVINKGLFVISIISIPVTLASLFLTAIHSSQRNSTDDYIKQQLDSIKNELALIATHGQIIGKWVHIPKPVLDKLGNPDNVIFRIQEDMVVVESEK